MQVIHIGPCLRALAALALALATAAGRAAPEAPPAPRPLNMAVILTTLVSSALQHTVAHDLVLRDELARRGAELRLVPFAQGAPTVAAMQKREVDVALLGDLSVLRLAPTAGATGVAMLAVSYSSVVGRGVAAPRDLAGKRVGLTPGSVGEHALLRALAAANLGGHDIKRVPMAVDAMPGAIERGEIDAFSAWEPTPKQVLSRHPDYALLFRNANAAILTFGDGFMAEQPQLASLLLAAFARAHRWLAADGRNPHKAVGWALAARSAQDGKPSVISVDDGVAILRASTLDVVGLPMLPRGWTSAQGEGQRLFAFLQGIGQIPQQSRWSDVQAHLDRALLQGILAQPAVHRLDEFRYAP